MFEHPEIEVHYQNLEPPFSWENLFGNTAPVTIEVGFGKCGFLIDIAAHHPTNNFLGIEVSRKYYRKGVKKIVRAELDNVKLLWGEAYHIVHTYVPEASVTEVYVNFPDPWPKKRHAKRRLLNPEFITEVSRKLIPGGCVEIATDVEFYIQDTMQLFRTNDCYELLYYKTSADLNSQRQHFTEYEQGFLEEGKTLHYARYRKR